MNLERLIINDITPVQMHKKIASIQQLFNNLVCSHVPVFKKEVFIGCMSENDLRCFDPEKTIEAYQYAVEFFSVNNTDNWLDVLAAFAQHETNIMPVLKEDRYIGYYELKDIINLLDQTPFFYESGAVIVVKKAIEKYSFSEVIQIVESNNAKALGAFVSKKDADFIDVTLKITNTNLSEIMQSFRRYEYSIVSGVKEDVYLKDLKERSAYLKKYLNI